MSAAKKVAIREKAPSQKTDTSDPALVALLNRLKATLDPAEIHQLSNEIERTVFHKQFANG